MPVPVSAMKQAAAAAAVPGEIVADAGVVAVDGGVKGFVLLMVKYAIAGVPWAPPRELDRVRK